jgi:beta-phosphoglucomutase
VKAALFDMDGVLCNTQEYHNACYAEIAKKNYNITLDSSIEDKLKGVLRNEGAKIFCKAVGIRPNKENIKYISTLKNNLYLKKIEENKDSLLATGTIELLQRLKNNNVSIALVSASANAKTIIKLTKIEKYFDYVVDAQNIGKGKPNPAIFLEAAAHLAIKPSDCVVYEDAINGIQAANDCDMYSIAVNVDFNKTTFTYSKKIADRYVKSLDDPLCYKGLYENLFDLADDSSLFIFDAGNVVIKNIHCFNGIFDQYNFTTDQKSEFIKDFNFYTAPLMDGNISTEFFLNHVNKNLNLNISGDPFYNYFNPVFNVKIVNLINKLKESGKKVVLGSNTFAPHTKKMKEMGLFDLFDSVYVSNEIHHYKPNPSFFRYILEKENIEAEKAYFVDDISDNIASAASLNIKTLHYTGENKDEKLDNAFAKFL